MVKAFIVHGKDKLALLELKDFIKNLGLESMILEEQGDLGDTIIEKFERVAMPCQLAFVIMTPDDSLNSYKGEKGLKVPRQNVLIELGWFFRHIGRKNVIILYKKNTEVPSNIKGVLYLEFENSILEVSEKIRSCLKALRITT